VIPRDFLEDLAKRQACRQSYHFGLHVIGLDIINGLDVIDNEGLDKNRKRTASTDIPTIELFELKDRT